MRKMTLAAEAGSETPWLNIAETACVEVTSEARDHPIEKAFGCNEGGWRAAVPGEQSIRISFDPPVPLRHIQLRFIETTQECSHEFSLHWWDAKGSHFTIVRQQWNFSPGGSTTEVEDYHVNLEAVAKLELTIRPGAADGQVATLDCWRIA